MGFVEGSSGVDSSVKGNSDGNRIADLPAGLSVECFDLDKTRVLRIRFDNRIPPKPSVRRDLDFDRRWGVANVATVDFNSGAAWL